MIVGLLTALAFGLSIPLTVFSVFIGNSVFEGGGDFENPLVPMAISFVLGVLGLFFFYVSVYSTLLIM